MENGHFLTKTMDWPLWRTSIFLTFFMSTKHSFVSRISRNSLFVLFCGKKLSCLLPFPVALWLELGLAFCTTEKHLSLPSKCSKVHFPWGRTNLKEGSMGGKHSMGWDGSILFLFSWERGRATFQRYVWGGLAFHKLLYTNFKHFPTHLYILQLQLVKSRPFQIYRLKRVLL